MKVQLHNYVKPFIINLLGDLVSDPTAGQLSRMFNLLTDHLKMLAQVWTSRSRSIKPKLT